MSETPSSSSSSSSKSTLSGSDSPDAPDLARARACRQSILQRPFVQPEGALGWLAAQIMSRKNVDMNRFCFEQLDVWPRDRVLEIGFGPGRTLQWLIERASEGFVAGVDPAALMVERAARRHHDAVETGRLQLHCCGVSALPFGDGNFDKAIASNNFQFWPDYERDLREVRRVLRPGGTLMLCLRAETPGRRSYGPVFSRDDLRETERLLWRAGFGDVRQRREPDSPTTLMIAHA